jgi:hypothetical protein
MLKILTILQTVVLFLFCTITYATPQVYVFLDGGPVSCSVKFCNNKHIAGAEVIYSWKRLEIEKDKYDFSSIQRDLNLLNKYHKKLYIQIQDRSFLPNNIPVPSYLLTNQYHGGVAEQSDHSGSEGWVAMQWDPAVRERFQLLLKRLGEQFDGKIAGIILPETSADFDMKHLPYGFSCDKYFNAVTSNLTALRSYFHKSIVMQFVNFFPCEWNNDHQYMSRLFAFAKQNSIALGGPDDIPYRTAQMQNSYPFFHQDHGALPLVGIGVQEPDYNYINPKTNKPFSIQQFYDFANDYLGAEVIFWNVKEPEYSQGVLPWLDHQ